MEPNGYQVQDMTTPSHHSHPGGLHIMVAKSLKRKKNWIQGAVKNPGGLHRALDVPQGKPIPSNKLSGALHSNSSHMRHMAQFAQNMKGLR